VNAVRRLAVAAVLSLLAGAPWAQSASVQRSGDAVVFDGRIDRASADEFLRLAADPAVRRLVIRSQGGLVAPALDMADAIVDHGLDVEVNEACFSSCANYLFPAGRNKVLSGPAAVAWHGNMAHVLYRAQRGEEHWSEAELADARALARREDAFFRRIGVDGFVTWFGKIAPYAIEESYALSTTDMAGFGITNVSVRDPAAPPASTAVSMVTVDWALVRAQRPQVDLGD
jgi:hypothetical protein